MTIRTQKTCCFYDLNKNDEIRNQKSDRIGTVIVTSNTSSPLKLLLLILFFYPHCNFFFVLGRPPNITLRIMSRIEQPFVMERRQKEVNEILEGNDRYEVCLFILKRLKC